MAKNVKQVYDANPTTTCPGTALVYLGLSPYGIVNNDSAILASNLGVAGLTAGSIIFANSSGNLSENNSKLIWDNTNFRLGIGGSIFPTNTLTVRGDSYFGGDNTFTGGMAVAGATIQFAAFTTGILHVGVTGLLSSSAINLASADITGTLGVANGGTGTSTTFTQGSIIFAGASGVFSQNNTALFWNNSTGQLGIGTSSPSTDTLAQFTGSKANIFTATGTQTAVSSAGIQGTYAAITALGPTNGANLCTSFLAQTAIFIPSGKTAGIVASFAATPITILNVGTVTDYAAFYFDGGSNSGTGTYTNTYGLLILKPIFGTTKITARILGRTQIGTAQQFDVSDAGVVTSGTWNGSVISEIYGGTNQSSYATGDLIQASATNTLSKLAAVATGNVLISGGVTTASSWGKVGLTTHVSGTLGVGNGGTGQTTYTDGQLLIGNSTGNTLAKATLTAGTGMTITNGGGSITLAVTGSASGASFRATKSSDQTNATGDGTLVSVTFDTETFDNGNVFASNTFTAPATGLYFLVFQIRFDSLGASHTQGYLRITAGGTDYDMFLSSPAAMRASGNGLMLVHPLIISLNASDTAVCKTLIQNSTKTVAISSNTTSFSGFRVA